MSDSVAALIFLGAGGLLTFGALALAWREAAFRNRGTRTFGVVRDRRVSPGSGADSGEAVTITVEYEDATGTRRLASTPIITGGVSWGRGPGPATKVIGPPDCEIDDEVPILYDAEHPEKIRVDTAVNRWFGPVLMGVMGVVFLAFGLLAAAGGIR
jgi:Protein of unknown function (DUF3592)